ncbi:hypothetical protein BGX23_006474 [Mortierella sp. AD031]|nr:hypothetical protein BGX23_006474 [Mortierella sp. AD031]
MKTMISHKYWTVASMMAIGLVLLQFFFITSATATTLDTQMTRDPTPSTNSLIILNHNMTDQANEDDWYSKPIYPPYRNYYVRILVIGKWQIAHGAMTSVVNIQLPDTTTKMATLSSSRTSTGRTKTPSTIAFIDDDDPSAAPGSYKTLIGDDAEAQRKANPANTIYDWQRFIFRSFDNETLAAEIRDLPYKVVRSPKVIPRSAQPPQFDIISNALELMHFESYSDWSRYPEGQALVQVTLMGNGGKQKDEIEGLFRPEYMVTLLINRMRELAESQMGETMNRTVLVIPESFSSDQRWAVVEAAESVGLTVRRVNERRFYPMFVYGGVSRTLMMVNLEGEVLEMTMVELGGNWREKEAVEVRDGRFGERAAERVVAEYLVDEYLRRQEGRLVS